jgi:hypothetical protein
MPFKDPEKRKEYNRKYQKKYYENNKDEIIKKITANKIKRVAELIEWVNKYKSSRGCSRCSENDPICLEFHHVDSTKKEIGISKAIQHCWSDIRLQAEIDKCIILCSNCHKKEHRNI